MGGSLEDSMISIKRIGGKMRAFTRTSLRLLLRAWRKTLSRVDYGKGA